MSRLYTAGTTHNLICANYSMPAEGTILVWCMATFTVGEAVEHSLYNITDASGPKLVDCVHGSNGHYYCGWYKSGDDDRSSGTQLPFIKNVWTPFLYFWKSGGKAAWIGNYSGGPYHWDCPDISSYWDTSAKALNIGNDAGLGRAWGGYIGSVTIWNKQIPYWTGSAWLYPDLMPLYYGTNPMNLCPGNIIDHWPMWDSGTTEHSIMGRASVLTVSGPAASSIREPVSMPIIFPPARYDGDITVATYKWHHHQQNPIHGGGVHV